MPSRDVRVLIVDDEPLARRGIRLHVERAGGFVIAGEGSSGAEAIALIGSLKPDVVFLDVQMPDGGGFDVVERVGASMMPVTVFVTAYDEHALRAFDAQALDYVLKPIDPDRFGRTLVRVRARVTRSTEPRRLVLRDGARSLQIDCDDIDWIEADGDYIRVHAAGRNHLVRNTLASVSNELDVAQFVRVHRSAIVNAKRVTEVRPAGDRAYRVILRDGTVVRTSRGYRDRVLTLLA